MSKLYSLRGETGDFEKEGSSNRGCFIGEILSKRMGRESYYDLRNKLSKVQIIINNIIIHLRYLSKICLYKDVSSSKICQLAPQFARAFRSSSCIADGSTTGDRTIIGVVSPSTNIHTAERLPTRQG